MTLPRELDARAVGVILLLSALWGANVVAVKIRLEDSQPLALAWMRFFIIAGFNFIANMWVLKHYRPSAVAAFSLTTPIFSVLSTGVILREPITWTLALATLLVAAGIAVATIRPAAAG